MGGYKYKKPMVNYWLLLMANELSVTLDLKARYEGFCECNVPSLSVAALFMES